MSVAVVSRSGGVGHRDHANEVVPALSAVVAAGAVLLWQAWQARQRIGGPLPIGPGAQAVVATGLATR